MERMKLNTYLQKCSIQRNLLKNGFILVDTGYQNDFDYPCYFSSYLKYKEFSPNFEGNDLYYLDTLLGLRSIPIIFCCHNEDFE